jgi:Putative beta barrel porin-7 (BBP7)
MLPSSVPDSPSQFFAPDGVHRPDSFFIGEYLLWWLRQDKTPPLVTTSSNPFDNGEIGRPTTRVLFGGDGIGGGDQSGFRLTAGCWSDDCCKETGFFVRGFYLLPGGTDFNVNSNQYPTLARPFFNVNQDVEFAEITAFPGRFTGSESISQHSQLFGAEANALCSLCCGCNYRLDLYGGFRFLDLEESLLLTEDFHGLPTAPAPYTNTSFVGNDYFSTSNQFYGGQIGLWGEYNWGAFSVEAWGQVAIGDTHQSILIDGSQVETLPDGSIRVFKGDLFAQSSNIGRYNSDRFGFVPEFDINVGYLLTDHVRAFIGYDVLYWNSVVRPGQQIDRNIDVTLIPNFAVPGVASAGQNQPAALRPSTDFWAQGLTLGFEIRY